MDLIHAPWRCPVFLTRGKGRDFSLTIPIKLIPTEPSRYRQRVYTESDYEELEIITQLADQILADLTNASQAADVTLPDDVELVLELDHLSDETTCGYYFANNPRRCLFWLDMFDANNICDEIKVIISESHLSQCTVELWSHANLAVLRV